MAAGISKGRSGEGEYLGRALAFSGGCYMSTNYISSCDISVESQCFSMSQIVALSRSHRPESYSPSGCDMKDNPGVPLASQNSKSKSRLGVRHCDGVMHCILCSSENDSSSLASHREAAVAAKAVGFLIINSLQKGDPSLIRFRGRTTDRAPKAGQHLMQVRLTCSGTFS